MNDILKQKTLTDLPECVYYLFQEYLPQDAYQQLLNTSKADFNLLARKTIIYRLTMEYSIKYCEDENFRYQLLQKVENSLKQIIVTCLIQELNVTKIYLIFLLFM